jgi:hypothetical protein
MTIRIAVKMRGSSRFLSNTRGDFFGAEHRGKNARSCAVAVRFCPLLSSFFKIYHQRHEDILRGADWRCVGVLVCWCVLASHQHTQADMQQRLKASMLVCWRVSPYSERGFCGFSWLFQKSHVYSCHGNGLSGRGFFSRRHPPRTIPIKSIGICVTYLATGVICRIELTS